ncbi:MAG: potassium-transporting ATPase subunit C [Pseudonocardia sp.]
MVELFSRQAGVAARVLVVMTLLLGVAYPLAVWAVAHLPGLSTAAEGSVVRGPDGTSAGSSLIGIDPVAPPGAPDPWFHTRPSATARGVLGPADPSTSGASNKGGFNPDLLDAVEQRRAAIAAREGVDPAAVPPDAVTASASGLDPDISPAYAQLQVARVARVTGLSPDEVRALVAAHTDGRSLGFLGEPGVNVTELNLALTARWR